jgi:hypothetical protein
MARLSGSRCTPSVTLTKYDPELRPRSESRDADVPLERRIVVTGRSTGSPRFGLELKANTEPLANRRASVIGEPHNLRIYVGVRMQGGSQ